MIIGVVKESQPGETRVAATPTTVKQLRQLGYDAVVEPGAGDRASFPGQGFVEAGAAVGDAWTADVVFAINAPTEDELKTYCRDQMAVFKVPKTIHVVEGFPTDPQGKVLKRELRKTAAGTPA